MEIFKLYKPEIPHLKVLSSMKNNTYDFYEKQIMSFIDKSYIIKRKTLIGFIKRIANKMGFKSQTFFLAVLYLDIIFSQEYNVEYNYNLLALGCLIISSKYCENVPNKRRFQHFINFYNIELNTTITREEIFKYEIIICKILNYKLNYFTIYDFNYFFVGNGIIKIEQIKSIYENVDSTKISKILAKIYEKSRYYLNIIIENLICLKFNSILISICILEKSIEYVLLNEFNSFNLEDSISINDIKTSNKKYFNQVMSEFYKLEYESLPEYQNLIVECENYKLFEEIYDNIDIGQSNIFGNFSFINSSNSKIILHNNESQIYSKKKKQSSKQSPNKNTSKLDLNDKIYKKVNIHIYTHKNNHNMQKKNNNISKIKEYSSNKKEFENEIKNYDKKENINTKRLTTMNGFYLKTKEKTDLRNSNSQHKRIYNLELSKNKDSFKKSVNILMNLKKSNLKLSRDNSTKDINIQSSCNNNIGIAKPYVKKKIHDDKINNRKKNLLYESIKKRKERNNTMKKILISKDLNNLQGNKIRGRSLVHNQKKKIQENNLDLSPIYEKNNLNSNDKNSKRKNEDNDSQSTNINPFSKTNSIYFQEIHNNNYKINLKYNLYNSNLTSRNSYASHNNDNSFGEIKTNNISGNHLTSAINDFINIDVFGRNNNLSNSSLLQKNTDVKHSLFKINRKLNESSYFEQNKVLKHDLYNNRNKSNSNFHENNDKRRKSFSNLIIYEK